LPYYTIYHSHLYCVIRLCRLEGSWNANFTRKQHLKRSVVFRNPKHLQTFPRSASTEARSPKPEARSASASRHSRIEYNLQRRQTPNPALRHLSGVKFGSEPVRDTQLNERRQTQRTIHTMFRPQLLRNVAPTLRRTLTVHAKTGGNPFITRRADRALPGTLTPDDYYTPHSRRLHTPGIYTWQRGRQEYAENALTRQKV
jgi:hypothetical protein